HRDRTHRGQHRLLALPRARRPDRARDRRTEEARQRIRDDAASVRDLAAWHSGGEAAHRAARDPHRTTGGGEGQRHGRPHQGSMSGIVVLMDHVENRRLLANWLSLHYEVVSESAAEGLDGEFDLGIVDRASLERFAPDIDARKRAVRPLFLPFLLVTPRP